MERRESPCKHCKEKPCKDNPYNEDGECWQGHINRELLVQAHLDQKKQPNGETR